MASTVANVDISIVTERAVEYILAYLNIGRFKLPIRIDNDSIITCSINFDLETAAILKKARILIWDEAMSARKELLEAVDRFFRELFKRTYHLVDS